MLSEDTLPVIPSELRGRYVPFKIWRVGIFSDEMFDEYGKRSSIRTIEEAL